MKLVLKVVISVLVLLLIAGTVEALFHSAPTRKRVMVIAGREVTIPADTPRNVFAVTKAAMGQIGFRPWYRNCIIGQAERFLTPREARALAGSPNPQKERLALNLAFKVQSNCVEPGRDIVDPNVNSVQLSILRVQIAETVRLELAKERSSQRLQTCAANQIKHSTDAQTLELVNGSKTAQEALLLRLVKPCI